MNGYSSGSAFIDGPCIYRSAGVREAVELLVLPKELFMIIDIIQA